MENVTFPLSILRHVHALRRYKHIDKERKLQILYGNGRVCGSSLRYCRGRSRIFVRILHLEDGWYATWLRRQRQPWRWIGTMLCPHYGGASFAVLVCHLKP